MGSRLPVASELQFVRLVRIEGLRDSVADATGLFFRQAVPNVIKEQLRVLQSLSTNSINESTWNIWTRFKIEQSGNAGNMCNLFFSHGHLVAIS